MNGIEKVIPAENLPEYTEILNQVVSQILTIIENTPTAWLLPTAIVIAMHHTSVAAITLLLHRDMTHRALSLHPKLKPILEGYIRVTSSIVAKEWVAAHTQHHKESDNKPDLENGFLGDTHTPQYLSKGKMKYLELMKQYFDFGFQEYFQIIDKLYEEGKIQGDKPGTLQRYAPSLAMFASYMAMFGLSTGAIMSVTQAALGRLTITLVNGVGHSADERKDINGGDHSKNITSDGTSFLGRRWNNFLSFQTVGEEHHGNHHENMKSADITLGKGGFDLGYWYARQLERVRLVTDIKVPKKKEIIEL